MPQDNKKQYNIEHRKTRLQAMIYDDQYSWIKRNHDKSEHKSESAFITRLISLGINAHREEKLKEAQIDE